MNIISAHSFLSHIPQGQRPASRSESNFPLISGKMLLRFKLFNKRHLCDCELSSRLRFYLPEAIPRGQLRLLIHRLQSESGLGDQQNAADDQATHPIAPAIKLIAANAAKGCGTPTQPDWFPELRPDSLRQVRQCCRKKTSCLSAAIPLCGPAGPSGFSKVSGLEY
jgi:hypothetical protein